MTSMTLPSHDVTLNRATERLPDIVTANAYIPIRRNPKTYSPKIMRSFSCNRETIFLIVLVFFTSLVQSFRSGNSEIRYIGRQLPLLRGTKMYFAIAAMTSEQSYARAFNKALMNITQSYLEGRLKQARYNITLDTLAIELPENGSFSAVLLESLCAKFEGKHVVAILIIGNTPAAQTVSLTATHAGIPVLWARGQGGVVPGFRSLKVNPLEIHLAPTGREMAQALRGLFLQAHWHSFTILADSESTSALQRHELSGTLSEHPLHPTLIPLPSPPRAQIIFRKLADISRSTRGVVVLLTDHNMAGKILDYAKRLNMLDGHFVWLWINTSSNQRYKNYTDESNSDKEAAAANEKLEVSRVEKRNAESSRYKRDDNLYRDHFRYEINDMQFRSLLKNDPFLLLTNDHHRSSIEGSSYFSTSSSHRSSSSYLRTRRETHSNAETVEHANVNTIKFEENMVLPQGLLSLRPLPVRVDRQLVKGAVRLLVAALERALYDIPIWLMDNLQRTQFSTSCWKRSGPSEQNFSLYLARELEAICTDALAGKRYSQDIGVDKVDKSLVSNFEILNLVPEHAQRDPDIIVSGGLNKSDISEGGGLKWKRVGMVSGRSVRLDTVVWPGGDISVAAVSSRTKTVFRVVTALAPPFVMESDLDEDGQCLRGLPCHRVLTADKDNLTLVFNELEYKHRQEGGEDEFVTNAEYKQQSGHDYEDDERFLPFQRFKYRTHCCYGLSMDLLENVAQELEFGFQLYIVADGLFGTKVVSRKRVKRDVDKAFINYKLKHDGGVKQDQYEEDEVEVKWNGIIGDLVSGAAHMSFAPLSVSSARSEVIDYSVPYFFSGVSLLAAPRQKSEIPLMAFLLPFSPELWIAIFTSLNITAIAVAIYEWLSPFGLNPWGRQRSKNFSMSSALWVMWGLLCGHLVAFKAPKSWPNKFLINVWGGFSVIFVASYTANIAALIAGLFFHNTASNYHDGKLLSQRVGAPKASAAEYYIQRANSLLWEHMHKYSLENVYDGVQRLRNGTLDIIIADTPILDYYRATDHGCKLQKIGDAINQDTYAIGMVKGFPLKDTISAIIAKYSSNGYMDILQEKWYGALPCFKLATDIAQPRPLGVAAVTGVFILLGVGIVLGCLILLVEHLFFKYTLPLLRDKPKGSIWRSRNIMFFSQKLYRFINCVELVSPHHAARELVNTIRQGQITSLFQKSIKRKEHEQRRRRKSKAQFFDMIQEIRRQQQQEREFPLESVKEVDSESVASDDKRIKHSPSIIRRTFMRTSPKLESSVKIKSPTGYFNKQLFSPRAKNKAKSSSNLNVRRFSTDSVVNSQTLKMDHSNAVGRRLSKDINFLSSSPPDINSRRSSYLDIISSGSKLSGKSPVLSIENVSECSSKYNEPLRKLSDSESIGKKLATLPKYKEPVDRHKLQPQYSLTIGGSEDAIISKNELAQTSARSCQNISDVENIEMTNMYPEQKNNLSDDEIARRNKETIEQLQTQLLVNKPSVKPKENNSKPKSVVNPQIRIEIEDTSKVNVPPRKHLKTRHQSLGDKSVPETTKRGKLTEQSRSLDSNPPRRERSRSPRKCREHQELPPAPPPPNCSPRNSNGRSPLERLSKDELVLLWRSSESELRSHLLKAIRDKEVVDDPP